MLSRPLNLCIIYLQLSDANASHLSSPIAGILAPDVVLASSTPPSTAQILDFEILSPTAGSSMPEVVMVSPTQLLSTAQLSNLGTPTTTGESASEVILVPSTPTSSTVQIVTSFRELMPIPHRSREPTGKYRRQKPPSPELTSDATMKFVTDSLNKQLERKPKTTKRSTASTTIVPATSVAAKRKVRSNHKQLSPKTSDATGDHEPCVLCKYQYGDEQDPNLKDDWDRCVKCRRWWHETCAALSGSYKKALFTCDDCSFKKRKTSA